MNNNDLSSTSNPKQPTAAGKKAVKAPGKRGRSGILNLLLVIGIIVTIGLFVWAEQQRRDAQRQLEQTATELEEVRQASQRDGQEVAQQVLENVRRHILLPEEPQPTVATIVDIDSLREANPFYEKGSNGDHLIITEARAILYDPEEDIIIDVVPVSINRENQTQDGTDQANPTNDQGLPENTLDDETESGETDGTDNTQN